MSLLDYLPKGLSDAIASSLASKSPVIEANPLASLDALALESERRQAADEMLAWDNAKAQAQRKAFSAVPADAVEQEAMKQYAIAKAASQQAEPARDVSLGAIETDTPVEGPIYTDSGRYNDLAHLSQLDDLDGLTVDELVNRTLRGEFGNGAERRKALGKRYASVQTALNNKLKGL